MRAPKFSLSKRLKAVELKTILSVKRREITLSGDGYVMVYRYCLVDCLVDLSGWLSWFAWLIILSICLISYLFGLSSQFVLIAFPIQVSDIIFCSFVWSVGENFSHILYRSVMNARGLDCCGKLNGKKRESKQTSCWFYLLLALVGIVAFFKLWIIILFPPSPAFPSYRGNPQIDTLVITQEDLCRKSEQERWLATNES